MLLSFAQFEREVTAERIRDKIAASKAKGMWMGGTPPLGYRPDGRSLAIVDQHAALVRCVFERYLKLGTVRRLADALDREGLHAPPRTTATGKPIGGRPFSRGQLYLMLKCRTYLGEVQHKGQIYPVLHPAILDKSLWDAVQAKLAEQTQGDRRARAAQPSLLAGRIVDHADAPLIAVHSSRTTCEGKTARYRYYVSKMLHHEGGDGWRIPAREIEALVVEQLATLFDDPLALVARGGLDVPPDRHALFEQRCRQRAAEIRLHDTSRIAALVEQVQVQSTHVAVTVTAAAIAAALDMATIATAPSLITLTSEVRLTRSGRVMRLVQQNGAVATPASDTTLVRLLVQARRWWADLRDGEIDIKALAARELRTPSYITRVLRLAFLSPAVVDAILAGRQRSDITARALTLDGVWSASWDEQAAMMLPGGGAR